jgi:hypothetical protein
MQLAVLAKLIFFGADKRMGLNLRFLKELFTKLTWGIFMKLLFML